MPIRVMIDATYSRRAPLSGTGVYIRRVCEELVKLDEIELIEVANERRRPPAGGGLGSVRNLLADAWWTSIELPRQARRAGAEVIHHPLPARARGSRVPQVITVVDLAFERLPEHFDRAFRVYARKTHRAAAKAASAVICISQTTAADARELWRVPDSRIVVAPLGPGQELAGDREAAPRHFLYVGDNEPRKNLQFLLRAYASYREQAQAPLELVLAGSASRDGSGLRIVSHPDRLTLAELYLGAAALVHPSLYEGFGLTPLEAMALGTPVIAARSPGVVEVCGDAARYVQAGNVAGLARAMAEMALDPAAREALSTRGRERASQFSWAACARAHMDAYSLAVLA